MASVTIDPKKVNLIEKDIEDWLYENPGAIMLRHSPGVKEWIARQYRVPSGVIDLLGTDKGGDYVVVEVKNDEITAEALTQVSRYAKDIQEIIDRIDRNQMLEWTVHKVVVGKGKVGSEVQFEADALDITLSTFNVKFDLSVGGYWHFGEDYAEQVDKMYEDLATSDTFSLAREIVEYETHRIEESVTSEDNGIIEEAKRIISEEAEKNDEQEE